MEPSYCTKDAVLMKKKWHTFGENIGYKRSGILKNINIEKLILFLIFFVSLALGLFQQKIIYIVFGAIVYFLVKLYFQKKKK
jgi:hypothetical protein